MDPLSDIPAVEAAIATERLTGKPDERTKHIRVRRGIYSLRGQPGRYVIRIRLPAGLITPDQLDLVADLVQAHGRTGTAHLTTRQGLEVADVTGETIGPLLRQLEEAGLTTRRTGGNVVRNIVCCAYAGIANDEAFDVTPYALAADDYLRNHPAYQSMPRKIKIAFEGCVEDHVRTAVADIGLHAKKAGAALGFGVRVGGGLGAVPIVGQPLEEFTPGDQLLPTLEAILHVFNQHGNRANRARARLKWLIREWGMDLFRVMVLDERARLLSAGLGAKRFPLPARCDRPAPCREEDGYVPFLRGFDRWKEFNTRPQAQPDLRAVTLYCPLGDLKPSQLRAAAQAARRFSGEPLRLTVDQNILLRGVPEPRLPALYEPLHPEGLAGCCAGQIMDITRCVGSACCLSAITNPAGACRALAGLLVNGLSSEPALRALRIRVSGCPNSCAHAPAADIGLTGMAKRAHDRPAPHYALLLGGSASGLKVGRRFTEIPARNVAPAVERLLRFFVKERRGQESFPDFADRQGPAAIQTLLEDLREVPPYSKAPKFYRDLDATSDFIIDVREGECSA